jgi:L-asparaginase II
MIDFFSLRRQGYPEVIIRGDGVFFDERGDAKYFGDESRRLPVRSLLKPFQWLAACPNPKDPRWLIGASSHSGQLIHTQLIQELAASKSIEVSELNCPASLPMDALVSATCTVEMKGPAIIFHPCAAKHLMYRISEGSGDYRTQASTVHRRLSDILQRAGILKQEWLLDSCGLPTLVCEMKVFLAALLHLPLLPSADDLCRYWIERPDLVGGVGRLDTWICEVSKGALLAKEGADGLLAVWSANGNVRTGTMIKLDSGYNATYLAASLHAMLEKIDAKGPWQILRQPLHERVRTALPKDQSFEIGF